MSMFNNNYLKAHFVPKNPEKCLNYNGKRGPVQPITFRSSWEKIFCNWCDLNENILEWGSEIIEIPYISSVDGKQHRYVTDFVFVCKDRNGEIKKWLIEMYQEQYTIKNDVKQTIYTSGAARSFAHSEFPDDIYIDENGMPVNKGLVSFFDPKHISALLCNYSALKEES